LLTLVVLVFAAASLMLPEPSPENVAFVAQTFSGMTYTSDATVTSSMRRRTSVGR
jgi:hypothetical protein